MVLNNSCIRLAGLANVRVNLWGNRPSTGSTGLNARTRAAFHRHSFQSYGPEQFSRPLV